MNIRGLGWPKEVGGGCSESRGETEDRAERSVAFAALEIPDLVAVKAGSLRQLLL